MNTLLGYYLAMKWPGTGPSPAEPSGRARRRRARGRGVRPDPDAARTVEQAAAVQAPAGHAAGAVGPRRGHARRRHTDRRHRGRNRPDPAAVVVREVHE